MKRPILFKPSFALANRDSSFGDEGWLRAIRLADHTPRRSRRPEMLQQALFAFTGAV